jgi:hypothetical protein
VRKNELQFGIEALAASLYLSLSGYRLVLHYLYLSDCFPLYLTSHPFYYGEIAIMDFLCQAFNIYILKIVFYSSRLINWNTHLQRFEHIRP